MTLTEKLKSADEKTLGEIIRQAESYLTSQLASAIAADQKALAFVGTLAAAVALLGAGTISLVLSSPEFAWFIAAGSIATLGMLMAMALALYSARPVKFYFAGNDPAQWIEDIEKQFTFEYSQAMQAAHYSEMIRDNNKSMKRNARFVHIATWVAWGSMALAIAFAALGLRQ